MSSDLVALANFGGGEFDDQKKAENLMPVNGLKRFT